MPRSKTVSKAPARSAKDTLRFLPPDLLTVLASLYGVSREVANSTIQLLPFGSRSALETVSPPLATSTGPVIDVDGHRSLTLTDFAFDVIAEAKELADECPESVSDWTAEADEVARMVASRRGQ